MTRTKIPNMFLIAAIQDYSMLLILPGALQTRGETISNASQPIPSHAPSDLAHSIQEKKQRKQLGEGEGFQPEPGDVLYRKSEEKSSRPPMHPL